jgi:hypothetical protein
MCLGLLGVTWAGPLNGWQGLIVIVASVVIMTDGIIGLTKIQLNRKRVRENLNR